MAVSPIVGPRPVTQQSGNSSDQDHRAQHWKQHPRTMSEYRFSAPEENEQGQVSKSPQARRQKWHPGLRGMSLTQRYLLGARTQCYYDKHEHRQRTKAKQDRGGPVSGRERGMGGQHEQQHTKDVEGGGDHQTEP